MNGTRKHSTNNHVAAGTTAFRDRFREAYTIKTGPPPISRMSVAMKAAKSRLGVIRNAQSKPSLHAPKDLLNWMERVHFQALFGGEKSARFGECGLGRSFQQWLN